MGFLETLIYFWIEILMTFLQCQEKNKKRKKDKHESTDCFVISAQETLKLILSDYLNIRKILIKYLVLNKLWQALDANLTQITLPGWKQMEVNCCFKLTRLFFSSIFLQRPADMTQCKEIR